MAISKARKLYRVVRWSIRLYGLRDSLRQLVSANYRDYVFRSECNSDQLADYNYHLDNLVGSLRDLWVNKGWVEEDDTDLHAAVDDIQELLRKTGRSWDELLAL